MPHDTPLISTIVAGLVLAFIFGAIANRFRMPPLVGYLVAGVLVGPYTPGFVADGDLATELSELGVILLMFGVGLHFSLKDLLSVRAIAIPGAIVQIGGATLMGLGLALVLGWTVGGGLIFGLALSVASTVVLLKALQDRRMIDSEKGRIAVGWLIVEDLAMVLALVLIPALAGLLGGTETELHDPFVDFIQRIFNTELGVVGVLAVTVVKLAAFVGFMLVVGRRVIPAILHFTAHTGSRELFRLAVLAIALGVAAGAAYLFGVSLALGAFFAGMILSESELSHRAAQESLPLRDAFAVLFFVSVGMLFDPTILISNPLPVLGTLFIILLGKSVLAFLIVVAFKRPVSTALIISASLAQIGEFSFILAALGVNLGILPPEGRDLILAGAILSIILNPVVFFIVERLRPRLENRFAGKLATAGGDVDALHRHEPDLATGAVVTPDTSIPMVATAEAEDVVHPTALTGHIILAGFGRVGSVVAEGLVAAHRPFVLIEDAEGRINAARAAGIEVIVGNAASPDVLKLANASGASTVIIAIPNAFEAGQATEQCRKSNPGIIIIARAHSDEEEAHLKHLGANQVILGEREIGLGMLDQVNRDRNAEAEIAGGDAVAAALLQNLGTTKPEAPAPRSQRVEPVFAPEPVAPVAPVEPVTPAVAAAPAAAAAAVAAASPLAPHVPMPAPVLIDPVDDDHVPPPYEPYAPRSDGDDVEPAGPLVADDLPETADVDSNPVLAPEPMVAVPDAERPLTPPEESAMDLALQPLDADDDAYPVPPAEVDVPTELEPPSDVEPVAETDPVIHLGPPPTDEPIEPPQPVAPEPVVEPPGRRPARTPGNPFKP